MFDVKLFKISVIDKIHYHYAYKKRWKLTNACAATKLHAFCKKI